VKEVVLAGYFLPRIFSGKILAGLAIMDMIYLYIKLCAGVI
jgi:hypothetical protein